MKYLLILLLSGCASIDYSAKVAGWPDMGEPEVMRVSGGEMLANCAPYASLFEFVLGCAQVWFNPPRCRVWVVEGDTVSEEHERAHCAGFPHYNDDKMSRMLKANQGQ